MDLMQHTVAAMDKILALPPAKRRPDGQTAVEDEACNLRCEWIVTPDDNAEITAIYADFGGRDEVRIPISAIRGLRLLELEAQCTAEWREQSEARATSLKYGSDKL